MELFDFLLFVLLWKLVDAAEKSEVGVDWLKLLGLYPGGKVQGILELSKRYFFVDLTVLAGLHLLTQNVLW